MAKVWTVCTGRPHEYNGRLPGSESQAADSPAGSPISDKISGFPTPIWPKIDSYFTAIWQQFFGIEFAWIR